MNPLFRFFSPHGWSRIFLAITGVFILHAFWAGVDHDWYRCGLRLLAALGWYIAARLINQRSL